MRSLLSDTTRCQQIRGMCCPRAANRDAAPQHSQATLFDLTFRRTWSVWQSQEGFIGVAPAPLPRPAREAERAAALRTAAEFSRWTEPCRRRQAASAVDPRRNQSVDMRPNEPVPGLPGKEAPYNLVCSSRASIISSPVARITFG